MHPLDSVPAVRRMETNREDLVALEIAGPLGGADVENLYGLLEGAYALHDQIDLIVIAPDDEFVDWGEVSETTIEEGHEHARRHIRRCAVVGGSNGIASVIRAIGKTSESDYRRFSTAQTDEAWQWVGGVEA